VGRKGWTVRAARGAAERLGKRESIVALKAKAESGKRGRRKEPQLRVES
jgi:hypothetical protein